MLELAVQGVSLSLGLVWGRRLSGQRQVFDCYCHRVLLTTIELQDFNRQEQKQYQEQEATNAS